MAPIGSPATPSPRPWCSDGRLVALRLRALRRALTFPPNVREILDLLRGEDRKELPNTAGMLQGLQTIMADDVGPLRTQISWSARFRISIS